MGKFDDRVAIVTGGGQGLGRAICLKLSSEGATVAVADIKEETANETVQLIKDQGGNAFFVYCDVTKEESVQECIATIIKKAGKLNYIVNNTGMAMESRFSKTGMRVCDTPENLWDLSMNLNLKSVFLVCKHGIPELIKQGGGAICSVSSLAAYHVAFGASYAASKAAVIALTKSMAWQYADDNIRVNCVCPGPMDTPSGMSAKKIGIYADSQPAVVPPRLRMINRIAQPSEIANVISFLLSDEASYMTGTEVKVDGGSVAISVKIAPRVPAEETK